MKCNLIFPAAVAEADHSGFTLMELLAVVTIIGMFLAMTVPSLMPNQMMELDGNSQQLAGFYEEARAEAMSYGEPVRLLIHNSPENRGSGFLRKVIAVRRMDDKAEDGSDQWVQILNPLVLPEGNYFDLSQPGSSNRSMIFPGIGKLPHQWIYYEIKPHGAVVGDLRNLVIGPGILDENMASPQFRDSEVASGFRITDAGRLIPIRSQEEVLNWSR